MTDLIPDEAVEAAYRAFCEARKGKPLAPDEYEATYSRIEVARLRAALSAAAPLIAAQATVDLCAGIEALRDAFNDKSVGAARYALRINAGNGRARCYRECADALDALLPERAR